MATLNAIVSMLAAFGMIAIAWGYRPSFRARKSATWFFTWGWLLLALSTGGRRLWWDVIWVNSETSTSMNSPGWMAQVNLGFNLLVLVSIYFGLKARQLLLPEHEQADWPWWRAWTHPKGVPMWRWFR